MVGDVAVEAVGARCPRSCRRCPVFGSTAQASWTNRPIALIGFGSIGPVGALRDLEHVAVLLLVALVLADRGLLAGQPGAPRGLAAVAVVVGAVEDQRAADERAALRVEEGDGDAALGVAVVGVVLARATCRGRRSPGCGSASAGWCRRRRAAEPSWCFGVFRPSLIGEPALPNAKTWKPAGKLERTGLDERAVAGLVRRGRLATERTCLAIAVSAPVAAMICAPMPAPTTSLAPLRIARAWSPRSPLLAPGAQRSFGRGSSRSPSQLSTPDRFREDVVVSP